jgi:hypothetical protein
MGQRRGAEHPAGSRRLCRRGFTSLDVTWRDVTWRGVMPATAHSAANPKFASHWSKAQGEFRIQKLH